MNEHTDDIQVRVIAPRELTEGQCAAWQRWCEDDAALQSPYFDPAFTHAVGEVRNDVRVAVLEDSHGLAGFFPFERGTFYRARPVGGRLSDFHGAVLRPGVKFRAHKLIRGCGASVWDFTHLPASQFAFEGYGRTVESSPFMDVSQGFDAYIEQLGGSRTIKSTRNKIRKLERDVGPLRFECHVEDPHLLQTLMDWKSRQYRETGVSDVFSFPWTAALLRRLHQTRRPDFGGQLSALYAGDNLVAAHFGMHSENVLHYWFPVYDPAYAKYSPGLVLVLQVARAAADLGFSRIDLGKGDERYKLSLASGAIPVTSGSVESGAMLQAVRRCWRQTRTWLKTSPVGAPARMSARLVRPLREWLAFR